MDAPSLRLDARTFHHLGPLFSFIDDELAESDGCHWNWGTAHVGLPRYNFGIGQSSVNLHVELANNFGGCFFSARLHHEYYWPRSQARTRQPSECPAATPITSRPSPPMHEACLI